MADPERPGAERWVPEAPATVAVLEEAARACRGCELWRGATHVVFSSGPPHARLMLVGEQPGDREDRAGEPFVGPAGAVLTDALDAAGIDPAAVYLTNAVKHFRFEERGKRRLHTTPGTAHVLACRPWLSAELGIVRPAVVVALGATAGRAVLGRPVRVADERGRPLEDADGRTVLLTTHPSAVLRLRGRPEWDAAFDGLVADLALASTEAAGAAS